MGSPSKAAASPKLRSTQVYIAGLFATATIIAFAWIHYRAQPPQSPEDILPAIIEAQGFTLNTGLSDLYQPGDVIQIADVSGELIVEPFLRASDCFNDLPIDESPFALPGEIIGNIDAALQLNGKGLSRLLPKLGLENEVTGHYRLRLERPRLLVVRRPDVSRRFSPECVARLNETQDDGDLLAWFRIVHQAVVVDRLQLEVEFSKTSTAEMQLAAERTARSALAARSDLAVSDRGKAKRIYELGRTVLGYKTRPLAPLEGKVSTSSTEPGPAELEPSSIEAEPVVPRRAPVEEPTGPPQPPNGRLQVLLAPGGSATQVVGLDHKFRTGDWFRFAIHAETDGWLYVFHQPPGGELQLLWPVEGTSNALVAGSQIIVPPSPEGWTFVQTTGEEYFYVAISSEARAPEVTRAPPEVVNYIVRGLARNVSTNAIADAAGSVDKTIALVAVEGSPVAAIEFRLRHE